MQELGHPFPKPTAQIEVFHSVLGHDMTVAFLMTFGAADLMFSANPRADGMLAKLVGVEKARQLAVAAGSRLPRRIPLAKRWLAKALHANGHSTAGIARQLRVSDVAVRGWLKADAQARP